MRRIIRWTACALGVATLAWSAIQVCAKDDSKPPEAINKPAPPARVLPGLLKDGFVQLPNQWQLKPAGRHLELGDLPLNIQIHPTGQFAAVLHCGMKDHEVIIVDLNAARRKVVSRTTVDQAFYGLAFSPDGKQVYASGGEFDVVHVWDFDKGLLHNHRSIDVAVR